MSDFSKSSVFALGQENTAYAQYFIRPLAKLS